MTVVKNVVKLPLYIMPILTLFLISFCCTRTSFGKVSPSFEFVLKSEETSFCPRWRILLDVQLPYEPSCESVV